MLKLVQRPLRQRRHIFNKPPALPLQVPVISNWSQTTQLRVVRKASSSFNVPRSLGEEIAMPLEAEGRTAIISATSFLINNSFILFILVLSYHHITITINQ